MEQIPASDSPKKSLAAKDGLILAAVTVVVSTLTFLTQNGFLSTLLWLVKLGGSLWLLGVIMRRYSLANPGEPAFGYGVKVCVLSAVVCAVWTFVEYQFLFPGAVAEAFEQLYATLAQMGQSLPEEVTDTILKMEDNYAQINCITTFVWCSLLGLLFSAIFARSGRRRSVFTEEEMRENNDDEFNF